jgi:hypothetical protein
MLRSFHSEGSGSQPTHSSGPTTPSIAANSLRRATSITRLNRWRVAFTWGRACGESLRTATNPTTACTHPSTRHSDHHAVSRPGGNAEFEATRLPSVVVTPNILPDALPGGTAKRRPFQLAPAIYFSLSAGRCFFKPRPAGFVVCVTLCSIFFAEGNRKTGQRALG